MISEDKFLRDIEENMQRLIICVYTTCADSSSGLVLNKVVKNFQILFKCVSAMRPGNFLTIIYII